MVAQPKGNNHGVMNGGLVQRLAELNLIRDPATVGTKTLVITRPTRHNDVPGKFLYSIFCLFRLIFKFI